MRHRLGPLAALLVVLLGLAGCADDTGGTVRLQVSAAASLADAFTDVAAALATEEPGVLVDLNVAGSATLVEQVVRGAPVDVLATADERTMARAVEAGVVTDPQPFATNRMVVAWPADGPERSVDDLADDDLLVGLCAPRVPCGATARGALADLGVEPAPDTEDADVRTLLGRLAQGELDVGVVYATDLAATDGAVVGADLPGAVTTLLVATTPDAPPAAGTFTDLLRSATGAAILREHGFTIPEEAA